MAEVSVGPRAAKCSNDHSTARIESYIYLRMIHVCSLARLHQTVHKTGARHVISLLKDIDLVRRPDCVLPNDHLVLGMDDITEPLEGYVAPGDEHLSTLLSFARGWNRSGPLVVHCYAGISRSTAGAYVVACALNPSRTELSIASALRRSSATASPNLRIVSIADRMLDRGGRMVTAIETIGRGSLAQEAEPFTLDLD
jgi:predicted protein tyrosine phosphatase